MSWICRWFGHKRGWHPAPPWVCQRCSQEIEEIKEAWLGRADEAMRLRENAREYREQRDRYEQGILEHAHSKGHDRCWENDLALYELLPPEKRHDIDMRLPPPEDMLEHCKRFIESRHDPTHPYVSPQAEIDRLRSALRTIAEVRTLRLPLDELNWVRKVARDALDQERDTAP